MNESRDLQHRWMNGPAEIHKPDSLARPPACSPHVLAHPAVSLSLPVAAHADVQPNVQPELSSQNARASPFARTPAQGRARMPLHRDLPLTAHRGAVCTAQATVAAPRLKGFHSL